MWGCIIVNKLQNLPQHKICVKCVVTPYGLWCFGVNLLYNISFCDKNTLKKSKGYHKNQKNIGKGFADDHQDLTRFNKKNDYNHTQTS